MKLILSGFGVAIVLVTVVLLTAGAVAPGADDAQPVPDKARYQITSTTLVYPGQFYDRDILVIDTFTGDIYRVIEEKDRTKRNTWVKVMSGPPMSEQPIKAATSTPPG